MKYEAVIFDLDGTLLNTLEDLADSINHCLEMYGYPTHTTEAVRLFVGNGIRKLVERALPDGMNNPQYEEIYQAEVSYYTEHSQVKTKAYDGIMELLMKLKEEGIQMAIVSNKNDEAAKKLGKLYFEQMIPVVIGATETVKKKPAPDSVWKALKELGVKDTKKALYVGDSDVDSLTASHAGMDCVLVTWGFRDRAFLEQFNSIAMIDHPKELWAYLQE